MSELIVIGYPDEQTATKVLDDLQAMERDYLADLEDAAVVIRHPNGKLKVRTTDHLLATGTCGGLFWGVLIGLVFLVPVGGLVLGGLVGAAVGAVGHLGIKEDFKKSIADLVKPGTSAIMAVIRRVPTEKVIDELEQYGGTVLRSSLNPEAEKQLLQALHGEQKQAA